MSTSQRKSIRKTLTSNTKFTKKEVNNIEIAIYGLCEKLTKEANDPIDELYTKFSYEKVGEIISFPDKINEILANIGDRIIGYESTVYEEFKMNERDCLSERAEGVKMAKGEFKCRDRKCGALECFYYQEQKRSCDEPPTTFVICTKCGCRYSFC